MGVPGEHRRLPAPGVHGPRRLRAGGLPGHPVPVRAPVLPGQDHRARGQAPRHPGRVPVAALVHHRAAADAHLPADRPATTRSGRSRSARSSRPDIDKPPEDQQPFVPTRDGVPFPFTLTTVDRGGRDAELGRRRSCSCRRARTGRRRSSSTPRTRRRGTSRCGRSRGAGRRSRSRSRSRPGDTSVEVTHLIFDGEIDSANVTSRPVPHRDARRRAVDAAPRPAGTGRRPRVRQAVPRERPAGPRARRHAGARHTQRRRAHPRAEERAGRRRLHQGLRPRPAGSSRPTCPCRGISRALGAIGESGNAPSAFDAGTFDPASFLSGAMPKLFGLFSLLDLLEVAGPRRGAGVRVRRARRRHQAAHRGAAAQGGARRRPGAAGAGGRERGARGRAGRRAARQGRARRARRHAHGPPRRARRRRAGAARQPRTP